METYKRQDLKQFSRVLRRLQTTTDGLGALLDVFRSNGENYPQQKRKEKRLNIEEICNDVLDALGEDIEGENIALIKALKVSLVSFPKNNLRSIIYNLIHNAVKYSDPSRKQIIQVANYKVEGFIVFVVEDNSLGIAEEHQEKVFKKSSRLNREIEGTGMGLYIIKKMVETHEGRVELESTLKKGSTFQVLFQDEPSVI